MVQSQALQIRNQLSVLLVQVSATAAARANTAMMPPHPVTVPNALCNRMEMAIHLLRRPAVAVAVADAGCI